MKGIHFFTKKIGSESGVIVSLKHLCKILDEENISYELSFYENDDDLINQVENSPFDVVDIHVPCFSDYVLGVIAEKKKVVVVSIHSTICNLQVEEDSLMHLAKLGDGTYKNLYFTCPSLCEVVGLNAIMKNEYLYLPNTFSYDLDEDEIEMNMKKRKEDIEKLVNISLISAYRPMKNMMTQEAAVAMLAKNRNVQLCLVDSDMKTPIYYNLLDVAKSTGISIEMIPQMKNRELLDAIRNVHVGLQVSLSETFSYVAIEHMIQGIPVIGSDSVPYASENASYSDVRTMYSALEKIVETPDIYYQYEVEARRKAVEVIQNNRRDALKTILDLIERA